MQSFAYPLSRSAERIRTRRKPVGRAAATDWEQSVPTPADRSLRRRQPYALRIWLQGIRAIGCDGDVS